MADWGAIFGRRKDPEVEAARIRSLVEADRRAKIARDEAQGRRIRESYENAVPRGEAAPDYSSTSPGFTRMLRDEDRSVKGRKQGGTVKKPGKKAVMQAVMAAHQAGIQKGAAMGAQPQAAPGAGAPPGIAGLRPGMKAGGKVGKEKFVPPWMKKEKKFAAGGAVGGGRGDGCASRGRTRGKMC